jgi:hypothetical protein
MAIQLRQININAKLFCEGSSVQVVPAQKEGLFAELTANDQNECYAKGSSHSAKLG